MLAFAAGGALSIGIKSAVGAWQARSGGATAAGPWVIYIAVYADLFSDGLLSASFSVPILGQAEDRQVLILAAHRAGFQLRRPRDPMA